MTEEPERPTASQDSEQADKVTFGWLLRRWCGPFATGLALAVLEFMAAERFWPPGSAKWLQAIVGLHLVGGIVLVPLLLARAKGGWDGATRAGGLVDGLGAALLVGIARGYIGIVPAVAAYSASLAGYLIAISAWWTASQLQGRRWVTAAAAALSAAAVAGWYGLSAIRGLPEQVASHRILGKFDLASAVLNAAGERASPFPWYITVAATALLAGVIWSAGIILHEGRGQTNG